MVMWSEVSPVAIGGMSITHVPDDERALLISDGIPDFVRLPKEHPYYPGLTAAVHDVIVSDCPMCSAPTITLVTEPIKRRRQRVVCCTPCGNFYWQQERTEVIDDDAR